MSSTQLNNIGGVALRDQIKQPLYDTQILTSASAVNEERQFFANTQGKPLSQSNLRGNGVLERNKSFRIMGIQIDALSSDSTKRELLALWSVYSYVQLTISEKQYWESPLRFVTGKIAYHSATGSDLVDVYQQMGAAGCNPVALHGTQALDIGSLTNFFVSWKAEKYSAAQETKMTPSADFPISFVCSLKGILRRPVQ